MRKRAGRKSENVQDRSWSPPGDYEMHEELMRAGDPAKRGKVKKNPFDRSLKELMKRMRGK